MCQNKLFLLQKRQVSRRDIYGITDMCHYKQSVQLHPKGSWICKRVTPVIANKCLASKPIATKIE